MKTFWMPKDFIGAVVVLAAIFLTPARADEGMWLFNNPPRKTLQQKHGFNPTDQWLEHLQRSSVRFNRGGSGSFVSANGLVMTNHHVGASTLHKLSSKEKDLLKTGFYAKTRHEELECPDMELNVLISVEDVTGRINAAVKPGSTSAEAEKARRGAMNMIEAESLEKTGLRSDVVTLYHGGLYHLYRFKKYTDVRLVFAPEQEIAFFGGDTDNFEYPRYDLDFCFFRVYEDDKPVKLEHYLKWSKAGCADGELAFVCGHPARTDRLNTVAHLEFLRDRVLPTGLNVVRRREIMLRIYSDRSEENARRALRELFSYQNRRKARLGALAGLQDPAIVNRKRDAETAMRRAVAENAQLKQQLGDAFGEVDRSIRAWSEIYEKHLLLERSGALNSTLFRKARTLLRMAEETEKPNSDRLREYRESNLDSLRHRLFSPAPIYKDLETDKLADSLGMYVEMAGADDELVRRVLGGKSPRARADELVRATRLEDVEVRKRLAEGGLRAVRASDDPMLKLARLVDPAAREVRKLYEQKVEEPQRQAYARIARARFALAGTGVYPDATFTLRLAFGAVQGYQQLGRRIAPLTTLGGLYRHAAEHGGKPPFAPPQSWIAGKDRLDPDTPCNFVCTADIIGGNSGSPVVNRRGEVVGLIFDGNRQSLVGGFVYSDVQARAVSVHSAAIVEALRKIYHAGPLADELGR